MNAQATIMYNEFENYSFEITSISQELNELIMVNLKVWSDSDGDGVGWGATPCPNIWSLFSSCVYKPIVLYIHIWKMIYTHNTVMICSHVK